MSTRLFCIRAQSPDVTSINEGCTIKLPEEISAIFGTKVKFHIARLIDEVDAAISTTKSSWSEFSHSPSSHRVGTTRKISLLKRQHRAITIRISNAEGSMQGKSVVSIEAEQTRAIEVELSILCVCYIKKSVLPITIGMELSYTSKSIKQIARRLDVGTECEVVGIIRDSETKLHDKQVLIVVAQDGITVAHAIKVVVLERSTYPRHVDIVEVKKIETIAEMMMRFCPSISPSCREHTTMELWAILHVPCHRKFGCCLAATAECAREEWSYEAWKLQLSLSIIFHIVLILIAFESGNGFESATKFDTQKFATTEYVSILVGQ